MAKQKKKRNKAYTGIDASVARPTITHISAIKRNKIQQWWFEKKRVAKPVLITIGVIVILIWLLAELIRIANGA